MLNQAQQYFVDFAKSFRTGAADIDRNINRKLAHTLRVETLARRIADAELTDEAQRVVAVRAALYHDLSRFEQFVRFRTFNDAISFDHGDRSAELVAKMRLGDDLGAEQRDALLVAVRLHNKIALPEELPPEQLLPARVVRDADKIDIMPILLSHLRRPEDEAVVYNLSRPREISPGVAATLARHESPAYGDLKTLADFIASKVVWVYDLNFKTSRELFRQRRYLEELRSYLPDTEAVRSLFLDACEELAH